MLHLPLPMQPNETGEVSRLLVPGEAATTLPSLMKLSSGSRRSMERKARAIELHYFGVLEYSEIGQALGVSEVTVHRDLRMARAWLQRELGDANDS